MPFPQALQIQPDAKAGGCSNAGPEGLSFSVDGQHLCLAIGPRRLLVIGRADFCCRAAGRQRGQCLLRVSNDGDPVPDEETENVFRPYCRLRPGGTSGAGLGLSIVR